MIKSVVKKVTELKPLTSVGLRVTLIILWMHLETQPRVTMQISPHFETYNLGSFAGFKWRAKPGICYVSNAGNIHAIPRGIYLIC